MRKYFALSALLGISLVSAGAGFGTLTQAHAEEVKTITDATEVSATFAGFEQGSTSSAYKVIDVNWDDAGNQPASPQYMWEAPVREWVKQKFPDYINENGSVSDKFNKDVGDAGGLTNGLPTNNGAAEFYGQLASAIKSGTIVGLTTVEGNVGQESASFTAPGLGMYLVITQGAQGEIYRPSVIDAIPKFTDAGGWTLENAINGVVKKSPASLTKTASDPSVGIDDTATFTVVLDVPVYPAGTINPTFAFYDKLPTGLSKGEIVSVKALPRAGGAETDLGEGAGYTKTEVDHKNAPVDYGLVFTPEVVNTYQKVTVVYTAKVNKDAVPETDMVNEAKLVFNNDPYGDTTSETTVTSTGKVHTYGLDLTKTDGTKALAGAEFSISKTGGGEALKFIKVEDGVYRLATAEDEGGVSVLAVSSAGKLKVKGLDTGSYQVLETKAPGGYVKLQEPVEMNIVDANGDGIVDDHAGDKGYYAQTIVNAKGGTLPVTGAQGIMLMATAGGLLLATGGGLVYATRRKES